MYRQPQCGNTHTAAALHFVAIPGGALPLQPLPSTLATTTAKNMTFIVTERMPIMANRQRNLGINIRVTPAEKKKIVRNAKRCKLTVSEYLRQIAMDVEPKELPSDEIVQSIMRLQKEVSLFERYAQSSTNENSIRFYREIADRLCKIQTETLQLLTRSVSKCEVKTDGDD